MSSSVVALSLILVSVVISSTNGVVTSSAGKKCSKPGLCCKNNETCCSDGCCPISDNAVCCSDGEHCCPTDQPVCCATVCCPSGTTCCSGNKCCSEQNSLQSPVESLLSSQAVRKLLSSVQFPKPLNMQNVQLSGPCNSYDVEKVNEGYRKCVYPDPLHQNIPTIGVGFNLKKDGAQAQIKGVGADYNAVLNGSQCLNDSQIQTLFNEDMATALSCGASWLPKWSSLGVGPQSAVADMAFNMGCGCLKGFICMKAALDRNPIDFQWAAEEMKDSKWCTDVKSQRCGQDIQCMMQGLKKVHD